MRKLEILRTIVRGPKEIPHNIIEYTIESVANTPGQPSDFVVEEIEFLKNFPENEKKNNVQIAYEAMLRNVNAGNIRETIEFSHTAVPDPLQRFEFVEQAAINNIAILKELDLAEGIGDMMQAEQQLQTIRSAREQFIQHEKREYTDSFPGSKMLFQSEYDCGNG